MGMTITEKILARRSGHEQVKPGDLVVVEVDLASIDDVQFSIFAETFERLGGKPWDPERAIAISDHYMPPSGLDEAEIVRGLVAFSRAHGLRTVTDYGIKHQFFLDSGLLGAGDILVATDSHTNTSGAIGALAVALGPTDVAAVFATGRTWMRVPPTIRFEIDGELPPGVMAMDVGLTILGEHGRHAATYKAIEWAGSTVRGMALPGRMTLCNLSTEFGAKNGIVAVDEVTRSYLDRHGKPCTDLDSDRDACFEGVHRYDAGSFEPVVAVPPNPANVHSLREVRGTHVDQAYLGSCTHGTIEDLRVAADVLRGRHIHRDVRLLVTPATLREYREALAEGLLEVFTDAGAVVCSPGCGSCPGIHEGTLARGEVRISTQNRNFRGRSGHMDSQVYLASPATVAASAIAGEIRTAGEV